MAATQLGSFRSSEGATMAGTHRTTALRFRPTATAATMSATSSTPLEEGEVDIVTALCDAVEETTGVRIPIPPSASTATASLGGTGQYSARLGGTSVAASAARGALLSTTTGGVSRGTLRAAARRAGEEFVTDWAEETAARGEAARQLAAFNTVKSVGVPRLGAPRRRVEGSEAGTTQQQTAADGDDEAAVDAYAWSSGARSVQAAMEGVLPSDPHPAAHTLAALRPLLPDLHLDGRHIGSLRGPAGSAAVSYLRDLPAPTELSVCRNGLRELDCGDLPPCLAAVHALANQIAILRPPPAPSPALAHVGVAYNRLATLPPLDAWAPRLASLDAAWNELGSLPEVLAALAPGAATLVRLALAGNPAALAVDYVPRVLAALPGLTVLDRATVTEDVRDTLFGRGRAGGVGPGAASAGVGGSNVQLELTVATATGLPQPAAAYTLLGWPADGPPPPGVASATSPGTGAGAGAAAAPAGGGKGGKGAAASSAAAPAAAPPGKAAPAAAGGKAAGAPLGLKASASARVDDTPRDDGSGGGSSGSSSAAGATARAPPAPPAITYSIVVSIAHAAAAPLLALTTPPVSQVPKPVAPTADPSDGGSGMPSGLASPVSEAGGSKGGGTSRPASSRSVKPAAAAPAAAAGSKGGTGTGKGTGAKGTPGGVTPGGELNADAPPPPPPPDPRVITFDAHVAGGVPTSSALRDALRATPALVQLVEITAEGVVLTPAVSVPVVTAPTPAAGAPPLGLPPLSIAPPTLPLTRRVLAEGSLPLAALLTPPSLTSPALVVAAPSLPLTFRALPRAVADALDVGITAAVAHHTAAAAAAAATAAAAAAAATEPAAHATAGGHGGHSSHAAAAPAAAPPPSSSSSAVAAAASPPSPRAPAAPRAVSGDAAARSALAAELLATLPPIALSLSLTRHLLSPSPPPAAASK